MKHVIVAVLVVGGVLATPTPSAALSQPGCLEQFVDCGYYSARADSFWLRTVRYLDCELSLWSCLKDALFW